MMLVQPILEVKLIVRVFDVSSAYVGGKAHRESL